MIAPHPGRLGTATAGTILLAVICASSARADHSNEADSGDPDNGDHYMDRHNLTAAADAASVWGRDQLNRAEDMDATFVGSGDVDLYDDDYGVTRWAGRVDCPDGVHWLTGNCDVFRLRYNLNSMAGRAVSTWRWLGCHELGHTAGLAHRFADDDGNDNSCMRDGVVSQTFDSHDIDAINDAV